MKKNINLGLNFFITHFTLAKLLGGLLTALVVATLKYYISGGFHIENSEWGSNVGIAFFAWTLNTGIIALLTDYLGIKGLNFNLKQFIYGLDTMKMDQGYSVDKFKPKLYNAMNSLDDSNPSKGLDKGRGIDTEADPNYGGNKGITSLSGEESNKRLDNGKVKVLLEYMPPVEPYRAA